MCQMEVKKKKLKSVFNIYKGDYKKKLHFFHNRCLSNNNNTIYAQKLTFYIKLNFTRLCENFMNFEKNVTKNTL